MSIRFYTLFLALSANLWFSTAQAQNTTESSATAHHILCSSDTPRIQIANASFTHQNAKGDIADWTPILHVIPHAYEFVQDAEGAYSPPYSARIRRLIDEEFGALVMEIPVPKCMYGKTARLKGYLKTQEANGTGAGLLLQMRSGNLILAHNHMDNHLIRGTTPWKPYSVDLKIPPGTHTMQIGLMLQEGGTVWGDDMHLEFLP